MLPAPVSFYPKRRSFRRNVSLPRRKLIENLLTRSRCTNLAVLLLGAVTFISVLFNVSYWLTWPSPTNRSRSILSTIPRGETELLEHLIIVPGHAIWQGSRVDDRLNEDYWTLESYQRNSGRPEVFFQHISQGVELSVEDDSSLVVFSGGQTRRSSTTTEAESYLRLALQANLFHTTSSNQAIRATTENYALDSFQNLLFSIARFQEFTGRYPTKITVVGYEMKRRRFTELHRVAIRWPLDRFKYVGVDLDNEDAVVAQEGERQNGYLPYSMDLYGCHSLLLSKRRARNPFSRFHPYYSSSPELRQLMDWCPENDSTSVFSGSLPWD